ncbi:MAG: leucine--tRNA ligase [Acidimicrobiales bacterium]
MRDDGSEPKTDRDGLIPRHRYTADLAARIELAWQDRWERDGTFHAPNPTGPLADGFDEVADQPKLYVLDMFPYPSGAGLHVGHPLGYIGTDVFARYKRMTGHNVMHTLGYDAFGLPAEQYAVQTGTHPRVTTEANIAIIGAQLRRLGLAHDDRRGVATTDVAFYRWTQWIFLQIHGSWYDAVADRARPIAELEAALAAGEREPDPGTNPSGAAWTDLDPIERRRVVDAHRLAYLQEAPVNWCPGLGTVLSNEEVTADGRSERGNFPVFRRPLKQWMMRITAYADRLLADLDHLEWTESLKNMQRHWIGRSEGAEVRFSTESGPITVFTTRPDTLFGATYLVLAPEHPLVDELVGAAWAAGVDSRWTAGAAAPAEAVAAYRAQAARKSEVDSQSEGRAKTGVFLGAYATNPVNGEPIPVFVADYVLMGYGTGAIMAVPAHDQRDFDFARAFGLPVTAVVAPPTDWPADTSAWKGAWTGEGVGLDSANDEVSLDGLAVPAAKTAITAWLAERGAGQGTVTYKLRDWLFSRQRYWGEPFPIVFDEHDLPVAVPEHELPVLLPEVDDYSPRTFAIDDNTSDPEPPLGRAEDWVEVTLDLGDGPKVYRRELNTMPNWAGSCWYELRYLDPTNENAFVDPAIERYWMGPQHDGDTGGVDLYVGGVEHAVLHLLYARFWHKVLFDLGHLSSREPFRRLVNQGYIQAPAYADDRGFYVEASEVVARDGGWFHDGQTVTREFGKIGKSLKNMITPDDLIAEFGADTLRLYEMFTGPLDQSRPWETKAVVGVFRLLQRIWRNVLDEDTGAVRVADVPADPDTLRTLHRAIAAVRDGMETLRFNTSIARITELNNHLTLRFPDGGAPRDAVEPMVLMLAPLAPHTAEELWQRLGHPESLTREPFPEADPALLIDDTVEIPVQINGKVKTRITVPVGLTVTDLEAAARADVKVIGLLDGQTVRKVIAVPDKLISFVVG